MTCHQGLVTGPMLTYIVSTFQDANAELSRLQPRVDSIVQRGENLAQETESSGPDKAKRIQAKTQQLKVGHPVYIKFA